MWSSNQTQQCCLFVILPFKRRLSPHNTWDGAQGVSFCFLVVVFFFFSDWLMICQAHTHTIMGTSLLHFLLLHFADCGRCSSIEQHGLIYHEAVGELATVLFSARRALTWAKVGPPERTRSAPGAHRHLRETSSNELLAEQESPSDATRAHW